MIFFASQSVEFPYTVKGKGILLPKKEWRLTKKPDGTILNILKDNHTNNVPYYASTEFERGDLMRFSINNSLNKGDTIKKGDTIGQISSHQEQFKLEELQMELEEQKRLRSVNITGEKPQRIKAALERLRMAEKDFENEKRSFERSTKLYEEEYIADEEFEQAQNIYNRKKQQVRIARANYEALVSGSKKEEIALIESRIESIEDQMDIIRERLEALTIESPVSGTFTSEMKTETNEEEILASVVTREKMVLLIPVEISRLSHLKKNLPVKIKSSQLNIKTKGKVAHIGNEVKTVDGRQTVFVTCLADNDEKLLLPNQQAEATIICDKITALKYLRRWANQIYTN
ncbi:MAG: HlyD family secretion protein [Bacteroidales bacterium]